MLVTHTLSLPPVKVDTDDEPHVEQEEKEDTTAADTAAAAATPATPADMVFAELHQFFL